ncbi:MAG: hypothetical protein JO132_08035 [Streptosporangiaceae bacterium]|nr:hypothetical protein [Streptosporangiaceae bacterium]
MITGRTTGQDVTRYFVRLSVPRHGGVRAWRAVSDDFERGLAVQESATVAAPHVESESRRGRDYVRVVAIATVSAADVVEALAIAWQVFRWAAADDTDGWDMAAAIAEIRPRPAP